jgi:O-antigen/teichoic acid export membrane protein
MIKKLGLSDFSKVLIQFASTQFLSKLINMASGFIVIRMLNPADIGKYNSAGIFLGYVLLGSGGVINGLGRDLPYYVGKGEVEYGKKLASTAWVFTIILSAIVSLFFLGLSIFYFVQNDLLYSAIYLSYVIVGFLFMINNQFLPVLYRNNSDFVSLSKQNIKYGLGNFVSVILVYFFGIIGLVLRGVCLASYQFFLLFKNKPIQLSWSFNFKELKELIITGFPIFAVGYINVFWTTILNSYTYKKGGEIAFGLFAISTVIQGALGIIPGALSGLTYPKMTLQYADGKTVTQIKNDFKKVFLFQFLFLLIMSTFVAVLLPFIVNVALPKYSGGIEAAQWMCFVPVIQSLDVFSNLYNVIKKQKMLVFSLIIGAFSGFVFLFLVINSFGFYLSVIPQAMIISTLIQQLLAYFFLSKFN